jgi:subtilase family serine protease
MSTDNAWCVAPSHGGNWSWKRWLGVPAMVLLGASLLAAQGSERSNRISQGLNSAETVTVAGTVHPLTRRASDLGAVNAAMRMESLTLSASLGAAEQTELNALLEAQQDAKSPQYHQWLTQEEYGTRFGLTDADLNAVTGWLRQQGFTVKGVSRSRNAIYFGGTAGQVEAAFHTQLHRYKLNGEMHFANATGLRVPAGIASVLLNVRGLNDFRLKPKLRKRAVPAYTGQTGPTSFVNFLVPADWATIYNVNPIYNAGYTGTGAYVGVVGQTYAPLSDITNFRSAAGMTAPKVTYYCIDPDAGNCTDAAATDLTDGNLDEADLDIEWSGGIAKNATVVFVYAPWSDVTGDVDPVTEQYYDVFDALQRAVQDYQDTPFNGQVLPVISMSYSDCEESFGGANSAYQALITSIGQQASSQGQTIVVSSGDTGAFGCDPNNGETTATEGVYVSVPVDSPNYTGVGGTTLSGDESDPTTYWNDTVNSSTGILVDSALRYIPETVWSDTDLGYGLSATGSGVSLYYPQPTVSNIGWAQPTPSNYSGASGRFVPDVAFAASPNHDGYLTCSQANDSTEYGIDCTTGFLSSLGYWDDVIGGTSASTPSFAGMLTLLVQKYGKLGNINPKLYELAANATTYTAVFHDITSGNNVVPCDPADGLPSDVGCPSSGEFGYTATTGYDMVTGLGSINGGALYTALAASGGAGTTTTTVEVTPSPVTLGRTITLTATVKSSSSGVIAGTVTFKVGSTSLGTATVTDGEAKLSNVVDSVAKGFVVGSNTISADYGGSTLFAASAGSTVLDVDKPVLTVTANNAARLHGAANPAFTYTITGFVDGDTSAVVSGSALLATTAVASSPVGDYPITFSTEGLTATNYSFSYVSGTLAVYSASTQLPMALLLSSNGATAGGAGFTLTVTGANFTSASQVLWNGAVRATTYVSSTQLTASIKTADIAEAATNLVTVANAAPSAGTSSALPFVVKSSAPVATISGGSISVAAGGSGDYTLTLTGSGFVTGSVADWNGTSVTTHYVSPWQVLAALTASQAAALPGTAKVVNPSGTSASFVLQ